MPENREYIASMHELFAAKPPTVSFEFFPPKSLEMEGKLWQAFTRLASLDPRFVSVTYGAGGSTRKRTHSTVRRIVEETQIPAAAHLTCVGATRDEIDEIARQYWAAGVKHIVALRGDLPENAANGNYTPSPDGYAYADDLVAGLKRIADFEISVAAYPEKHPEASSLDGDIDNLKRKIDAGATRAITQFFYNVEDYLRFVDKARAKGIDVEITPGIMPVGNFSQLAKFSKTCGTSLPSWMNKLFDGLDDRLVTKNHVSAYLAAEQCRILQNEGINSFHFYTLNRSEITLAVCKILGLG